MPKVITEKIEINDIELRDLDMTSSNLLGPIW